MADKMYFGVPGNIQEIPYPVSGMGFDSNVDAEVTELVSGGRSIYRAPTAYKTLSPNWRSNSAKLAHLIDMYNGQFGPGPFYITDPTASQLNVLPSRWSNAWQLAHQANGWCRPVIDTDDGWPLTADHRVPLTDRYVKFTQAASGSTVKTQGVVRTRLIRVPDKGYFLAVNGSATGGAGIRVRGLNKTSGAWDLITTFTTWTGVPTQVVSSGDAVYVMLELDLYLPLGATLTLKGLALSTVDYSGGAGVPRTNRVTNPSIETNTTGWDNPGSRCTLTSSSDRAWVGTKSLKVVHNGVNGAAQSGTGWQYAATSGVTITFSVYVWVPTGSARIKLEAQGAATASGTTSSLYDQWQRLTLTVTPGSTNPVYFYLLNVDLTTIGTAFYVDGALLETSASVGTYFDGATVNSGYVYAWTGTSHGSTSTETTPPLSTWMPRGSGIGAVQFDNAAGGELVSSTIDRIGLSLSLTEVQNVESVML